MRRVKSINLLVAATLLFGGVPATAFADPAQPTGSATATEASDPVEKPEVPESPEIPNAAPSDDLEDPAGEAPETEVVPQPEANAPAEKREEVLTDETPTESAPLVKERPSISYRAHVSNVGWQKNVADGQQAGTTGHSLAVEALEIELEGIEGSVSYRTHVSNIGWQSAVVDGATAGTTGRSLSVEALEIELSGEVAQDYDVYYRVHSANVGWLGWAKNGEPAGTAGQSLAVEAVCVQLMPKDQQPEGYGAPAFREKLISYQAHVSNVGWQKSVADGDTAGTTGRSLGIEALKVSVASSVYAGGVSCQSYVRHNGWQSAAASGQVSGTTGQDLPVQAIRLKLDGVIAEQFDIYYRVHVSYTGWMGWVSNGASAGTVGRDLSIEAVQIELVAKGGAAPGGTASGFDAPLISAQGHVQNVGWQNPQAGNCTIGTTGKALALESFSLNVNDEARTGSVVYQAHSTNIGWQSEVADGALAGTTGRSLAVQAVRMKLTGELEQAYDLYYRVHSATFGWLDWACNGATAGTVSCNLSAEAVQIMLVEKGANAPGATDVPYRDLSCAYKANVQGLGWQGAVGMRGTAGTTGKGAPLEQISASLGDMTTPGGLEYRVHSSYIGWQDYVADGAESGYPSQPVEAMSMRLTGDAARFFDVYYRVHVSTIGWMGWASNGGEAGTTTLGLPVEAYQVIMVPKGTAAPGPTSDAYRNKKGAVKRSDGSYDWYNSYGVKDRGTAISRLMSTANSCLGIPYVWDGMWPQDGGMDCSSFTWYVYNQLGIVLGEDTYHQMSDGYRVGSLSQAKPGDLILMYYNQAPKYNPLLPEHVVLYAGNGMIYEEPNFGGKCQYVPLWTKYAGKIEIRRIIHD
ncbi:NlpC/P60 family protein [Eggerthella guodeyinii]|nr:NlpC/P60 family protein [Eggerthella guodeyinii]